MAVHHVPRGRSNTHFYRITGEGTTVDMDKLVFNAQTQLTPPAFEQAARARYYLWPNATSTFELGATDTGGAPAYTASGLPEGAELDAATGTLTWKPTPHDRGVHKVQIIADDGEAVTARTFELVVAKNRPKMIDAAVADGTDEDAVYTTVSYEPYQAALAAAQGRVRERHRRGVPHRLRDPGSPRSRALELLNPRLADGSFDYRGTVTPTVISEATSPALATATATSATCASRRSCSTSGRSTGSRPRSSASRSRFAFPMRSQGTNVYGSNDGITWDLLTERETTDTNDMETIPVVAEHRGEEYRYLKLQLDHPGPPHDPSYPGIWCINEFRIFGDRSEVDGRHHRCHDDLPGRGGGPGDQRRHRHREPSSARPRSRTSR